MKSTEKNNRMTNVQIRKAADKVGRTMQQVELVYCKDDYR